MPVAVRQQARARSDAVPADNTHSIIIQCS